MGQFGAGDITPARHNPEDIVPVRRVAHGSVSWVGLDHGGHIIITEYYDGAPQS